MTRYQRLPRRRRVDQGVAPSRIALETPWYCWPLRGGCGHNLGSTRPRTCGGCGADVRDTATRIVLIDPPTEARSADR